MQDSNSSPGPSRSNLNYELQAGGSFCPNSGTLSRFLLTADLVSPDLSTCTFHSVIKRASELSSKIGNWQLALMRVPAMKYSDIHDAFPTAIPEVRSVPRTFANTIVYHAIMTGRPARRDAGLDLEPRRADGCWAGRSVYSVKYNTAL